MLKFPGVTTIILLNQSNKCGHLKKQTIARLEVDETQRN